MDSRTRARLEARADIVKAMAHPTRLFIIEVLSKKPHCVNDLTDMIGSDISTVSKHLSILRAAGIVRVNKKGAQIFYHLKVPCILNFFGCVEEVIKSTAKDYRRHILPVIK
jgi:DNA-binding transcriptional ArsR family regulator